MSRRESVCSNLNKYIYDIWRSNVYFSKHKKLLMQNINKYHQRIARIIKNQIVRDEYALDIILEQPYN